MQTTFVQTQLTLLRKLARDTDSAQEAEWARFFDLYYRPMIAFAELHGGGSASEDIVQQTLVKVVKAFKSGRYRRQEGATFRSYLQTLLRHELVDVYRREAARALVNALPLDVEVMSVEPLAGVGLDIAWRLARHRAAVDHVLRETPLDERTKAVYRAHVLEDRPVRDVAAAFGMSRNEVSQIKLRVNRRVAAVEAMYGE